jgi:hypothetical protein
MNQILEHYCQEHRSKFFRNEKVLEDGKVDVWYSHKKSDGSGFCTEKAAVEVYANDITPSRSKENGIFVCNAMNNAVELATSGKIQVSEIDKYFKKIYSELKTI